MDMKKKACVLCGLALTGVLASGCMPLSSSTASGSSSASTSARAYITAVHQGFSNIDVQMDAMKKAVSASDGAAVYAALDKVDQQVSALEAVDTPDELKEVQAKYVGAAKNLAQTLREYAAYRLEGGSTSNDAAAKLAAIQANYADGINTLKAADEIAKGL